MFGTRRNATAGQPRRPGGGNLLALAGMCLSGIGSWTTRVAIAWLMFRQTGSPLWLGLAAFAGQSPVLFCAPLAARLLARADSRRIYRATQALAAIQAAGLVLLSCQGWLCPWSMLIFAGLRGVISAFEHPSRQTLLAGLTRFPGGVTAAMAADGLQANVARLAGPLAAGLLMPRFGETACFLLDAASYGLSLAASLRLSSEAGHRRQKATGSASPLSILRAEPACSRPLILLATISLVGMTFTVLLPQFCRDVLSSGAEGLAQLIAASGAGACLAASAAIVRPAGFSSRHLPLFCALSGLCIALLFIARDQRAAIFCVGAASLFLMLQVTTTAVTLRETGPLGLDPAVLQSALFWGLMPFGSLLMGTLAHLVGPRGAYLAAGMTAITTAVLFSLPGVGGRARRRSAGSPVSRQAWIHPAASRLGRAERPPLITR